jgi:hypothetical protein
MPHADVCCTATTVATNISNMQSDTTLAKVQVIAMMNACLHALLSTNQLDTSSASTKVSTAAACFPRQVENRFAEKAEDSCNLMASNQTSAFYVRSCARMAATAVAQQVPCNC